MNPLLEALEVLGEEVLDVREHEFLVLFLVVQTQGDARGNLLVAGTLGHEPAHGFLHVVPVGEHFGQGGSGQQATPRPGQGTGNL